MNLELKGTEVLAKLGQEPGAAAEVTGAVSVARKDRRHMWS